ncbi:hypothetical protein BDZ45DRAFT_755435 [Acephala macrosclerotiorum]|nr:hypothetical protein BDZ45DRAFT_755435 [Acephala macrosclerotiorum]
MSPQIFDAIMWGLPLVSILFTFWLPAALQLFFFVSSLLSFGQATLFRQPWFRSYFNMTPLPQPKGSGPMPSPYKGNFKVAAKPVLSQAELNSRFQGANPGKGVLAKGRESLKQRDENLDVKERRRYEEKRQEELKKQRWELENRRKAERAARKGRNL